MQVSVTPQSPLTTPADALVVGLVEGARALSGDIAAVDNALGPPAGAPAGGAISHLLTLGDFSGKLNEIAVLYTYGALPAPRVILVGLGKAGDVDPDRIRQASGTAVRKARDLGCRRVATGPLGLGAQGVDAPASAQATVEGALLGTYQFREFKTGASNSGAGDKAVDELVVLAPDVADVDALAAGARAGECIAEGANAARSLINQPANVITPDALADFACQMAGRVGIKCTVLAEREIAEHKMGGLQAVSQGSARPPRFVILEHTAIGASTSERPLVLIGKGVTFDSGGLSLKEPAGMENMKADMSGAAAVIGAMQAIAALGVPSPVIGLVPMVENMPGGQAYRPGDIVTMMSGLNVEIISTDAEGRLILADALHFSKRYEPRGIVDLATLTGACVVALGEGVAAGLFANSDAWAGKVLAAADASGERLWRMPLYAEYGDKIKSEVADLKNTGGRTGGVGASAYFLKRFVDGEGACPWAHIDMAGMMFSAETKGCQPKGAVGYGVRTLVALARQ